MPTVDRCLDCGEALTVGVIVDHVTYVPTHPNWPVPIKDLALAVSGSWIRAVRDNEKLESVIGFDIQDIHAIEFEGTTEAQRRVTVTRVLALGVFALAVPKKEKVSYIVIETAEGDAVFEVRALLPVELKSYITRFFQVRRQPSSKVTDVDIRTRLILLKSLFDDGLITEAEFARRKEEILGDI
jgi:hypothetical protein